MTPNIKAFLDTIAVSEIGDALLAASDNGYNVLVGGALFHNNYADHPRILVKPPKIPVASTAAGRYQILSRYWDHYKDILHLKDFSPQYQDAFALNYIRECKALDDIDFGRFEAAIRKCASRWASLPGANYNQHENKMELLRAIFIRQGGTVNA